MSYKEGGAKYYDLFGEKNDVQFYLHLSEQQKGKALELGVGTARLGLKLARAGIDIWGIENSKHMLEKAREKVLKESTAVKNRIHLHFADVRDFDLGVKFNLIFFPSFSFDHLLSIEDQTSTLRSIHRNLNPEGLFAFDLSHFPVIKEKSKWFVQQKPLNEQQLVVRIGYQKINPENRNISLDLWFELYDEGKMIERFYESNKMYIHTPEGIQRLLSENKFNVIGFYGGYEKQEFNQNSKIMVIIAQPIS